ncbi:Lipoprotein signal peptidase [Candidatus Ecksteinia adelgidicola]|nr:Lipoprotein signal peptidase [Candidatus Ecksteinia adelgidicola]
MIKSIKKIRLCQLLLSILIIILDVSSKYWIVNHLLLGQCQALIPSINLFYTKNYGAVFSFLNVYNGNQRWFFSVISIIIIVGLLKQNYHNSNYKNLDNIAFSCIIGGAIGNLYDRLLKGFVIDFIDFYIGKWHYPTFNIADTFIVIGVIMISKNFLSNNNKF